MRSPNHLSIVARFKQSLTHNLNQPTRLAPRNIARRRYHQHARSYLAVATPNSDLVSSFDRVRRFCRASIKQNQARVAKLLGQGAARAKTA